LPLARCMAVRTFVQRLRGPAEEVLGLGLGSRGFEQAMAIASWLPSLGRSLGRRRLGRGGIDRHVSSRLPLGRRRRRRRALLAQQLGTPTGGLEHDV
jgi:hypothetical protein